MTSEPLADEYDAIVIGSGPNGLAAAIALARQGARVLVIEGQTTPGGAMRTEALTLPGFRHDTGSACHPFGILSPFFRTLPLAQHGLQWLQSGVSYAHPLDDQPAVLSVDSVEETAVGLDDRDAAAYVRLVSPFLRDPHALIKDAMGPLRVPTDPLRFIRFGLRGLPPATTFARMWFSGPRGQALAAGCAAHSILPLETPLTSALTLLFLLAAHVEAWPVPAGGAGAITDALVRYFRSLGGHLKTGQRISDLNQLPATRVVLFDTSPDQLAQIGRKELPDGYRRRLGRYRYGPGIFKVDWALDGPIPWRDPRVNQAATVHVGGSLEDIAHSEREMFHGLHSKQPFVMVVQQSELDPSRAPDGQHTGYGYCHVPHGSTVDMTGPIEDQMERFAPGFNDRIRARHTMNTRDLYATNPNFVGGAITGGVADAWQLFTRPVARLDPYSTPNPRLFICSASTPPGGGVHGMGGYYAAQSALKQIERFDAIRFS
ncbi:MAG: NAD(P)/FAD-dependent oxidoreductase [Myxococcota bacterium]